MKRAILRILDLLIIIAFFSLLYILIEPQYKQAKITAKRKKIQSNMFTVKAAIEKHRAFNEGQIPSEINKIYENVKTLELPVNPYTDKKMKSSDLSKFKYDIPSQIENTDTSGFNAEQRGKPGQISIGYFTPLTKKDTLPTGYGILGFDAHGKPLTIKEGEKVRVFVLND